MRFLVTLHETDHYARWDALDDATRERVFADFRAFSVAVAQRGSIVAGEALDHPSGARTVRAGEDRVVVDGPFAETVEQMGGFYVIDVPDHATACELAGLLPREYDLEVRPTVDVEIS